MRTETQPLIMEVVEVDHQKHKDLQQPEAMVTKE
jgi:hypothetical protein